MKKKVALPAVAYKRRAPGLEALHAEKDLRRCITSFEDTIASTSPMHPTARRVTPGGRIDR